jgi:hypothetical protein
VPDETEPYEPPVLRDLGSVEDMTRPFDETGSATATLTPPGPGPDGGFTPN